MTDNEILAELLLPDIKKKPEFYEEKYPQRNLKEGARVTRLAPSPTGYLHIGSLFMALVNRIVAETTGGVFFLRIEDTDKKREIEGGVADILAGLHSFGIEIDEGYIEADKQAGNYGPYKQSDRAEIYRTYAKSLIEKGLAYPCFCTAEELAERHEKQEADKIRPGYHGEWAVCRNLTLDEIKTKLDKKMPFTVRLRSPGNEEHKITVEDGVKGKIEMPENDEDFVILKSDGIPTYHFAHAIDDHLMHTTHVIRGDEWLSSLPKHIQLFKLLGFKVPKYVHVAPILKQDGNAKRKISKRKDPEAAVKFFAEQGFLPESLIEYMMTIAASDFEDWRRANKTAPIGQFKFNIKKMSVSGALFDWNKLLDVAKTKVSELDSATVTEKIINWAKEYDSEFYELLVRDTEYARKIFAIDRDGAKKPRKDIAKFDEAKHYCAFFYDELYTIKDSMPEGLECNDMIELLKAYKEVYDENDDQQEWFEKIKSICPQVGFAPDTKVYKENPEAYKGNPGTASTVIRIAVTGRQNTPDLCQVMKLLGKERCFKRIDHTIGSLS